MAPAVLNGIHSLYKEKDQSWILYCMHIVVSTVVPVRIC